MEIIEKKKIFFVLQRNWATAQLYCEKKKFYCKPCNCITRERAGKIVVKLYCRRMKIVLQYSGLEGCWNCIAIQLVYCNLGCTVARFCIAIYWFVLQIGRLEAGLDCIAIQSSVL